MAKFRIKIGIDFNDSFSLESIECLLNVIQKIICDPYLEALQEEL